MKLPDSIFLRPSLTLVFDNINDTLFVAKLVKPSQLSSSESFKKAKNEIISIIKKINKPLEKSKFKTPLTNSKTNVFSGVKSNTTFKEFERMVKKAKKYILEGEIFQVVVSRIFKKKIKVDALSIYRSLRFLNPSPYMFFMNFKDFWS